MAYLAGIIWCVAFGGLGCFLLAQRKKHQNHQTFTGKVKQIRTSGRNVAVIDSGVPEIGEFEFSFQDLGDYQEGQDLACIWDGTDPTTAQEDLRKNQLIGVYFCFAMVILVLIIMIVSLVLPEEIKRMLTDAED